MAKDDAAAYAAPYGQEMAIAARLANADSAAQQSAGRMAPVGGAGTVKRATARLGVDPSPYTIEH